MSAVVEADTLLAVDVGSVNTRASLFDVVEGRYRLVATGRSPSTANAPLLDVREGVRVALDQIQAITGRKLIDETESLIMPVSSAGTGVDIFVATTSAGPRVRTVLVGLMPGVSLESGRSLAASTYLNIVGELNLLDARSDEEQIDLILGAKPDLVLVVGGTDGGASASVLRMVELVNLAVGLTDEGNRPKVVYAGNSHLGSTVTERFGDRISVVLSPNVRPSLAREDLAPTRLRMAEATSDVRSTKVAGFNELAVWSGGRMMQTGDAFGRVVRYLSQIYDPSKGVLGVDVGANHTTVAAAFAGDLRISVRSDMGLGANLPGIMREVSIDDIRRWLPIEASAQMIRDYMYNKSLYPGTIPQERDEFFLEYAFVRQILRVALRQAMESWPQGKGKGAVLTPQFEPILAGGAALSRTPHPGFAALALLDAIQPVGITTLVLDPHGVSSALGGASSALPMVSIQVLGSGSFVSLATVVSPVGKGRLGRPALRLRIEPEEGGRSVEGEVRLGQLVVVPLAQGDYARLTLQPERGIDVGFGGPGKAGAVRVSGGAIGLVIDARGRPLRLQSDAGRQRELNRKWLWDIGALEG